MKITDLEIIAFRTRADRFSHGVCPDCYEKLSTEYLKDHEITNHKDRI